MGQKRVYLIGAMWMAIWALVSGLALTPAVMAISRAMGGIGAGLTM